MEFMCGSIIVWLGALLLSLSVILKWGKRSEKQPPGPAGWPVIGNILDLGTMPHRKLYELKLKYGAVVRLRLGSRETVVIQSAMAAEELFKHHDSIFCDRKPLDAFMAHKYREGSMAVGHYSPYWRMVRRICSMELMSNRRASETANIRSKCVHQMLRSIENDVAAAKAKEESGEVNLAHYLFLMSFNLVGNLILSRDLFNSQSKEGYEFFEAMDKVMMWAGRPNIADFLPFLRWIDPQRIRRGMGKDMGRALKIVEGFVKERIEEHEQGKEKRNDFLDVLLSYEGAGKEWSGKIPHQKVLIIILEMFFAGSETTSTTLEWAMTELMRNPEAMRKVKEEIDIVVGGNKMVEESDIDKLPYLQAVLKESTRLHPPLPLLLPRNALQDANFMGYHIQKDTQILVNAWAIGRDSDVWEDPFAFKPDRFLGSNIDYNGHNFELIPFGSGRRICVGITLAQRTLPLALAHLIHYFDWELSNCSNPQSDLKERMGITVRRLEPLQLRPEKRPLMVSVQK